MAPRRALRMKKRAPRRKSKAAKLSRPMRKAVKMIVRGQAETKRALFYESANNGSSNLPATGLFANRGWAVQNDTITHNNTDILQLIPFIAKGTDDWERVGKTIRPVGLNVKGSIRITTSYVNAPTTSINLHAYLYVLQHVSLKDYTNLRVRNDFTQLLETGEGETKAFRGEPIDPHLAVSDGYYKVLTRRKIPLKFAGAILPGGTLTTPVSVANSHTWFADYNINLTKHVPKRLVFPEDDFNLPPTTYNAPTNSSIFMAIGYVNQLASSIPTEPQPFLEQTYVAELLYKDM